MSVPEHTVKCPCNVVGVFKRVIIINSFTILSSDQMTYCMSSGT